MSASQPQAELKFRLILAIAVLSLQVDHIGRAWSNDDPIPVTRLICSMRQVAAVSGTDPEGNPIQVTAQQRRCPFGLAPDMIYVHLFYGTFTFPPGEETRHLAFKYRGAPPRLTWLDTYHFQISVTEPRRIHWQIAKLENISIDYVRPEGSSSPSPRIHHKPCTACMPQPPFPAQRLVTKLLTCAKLVVVTETIVLCLLLVECERIGTWWSDHDPQGEASALCESEDLPGSHGPNRWVVTSHIADCGNGDVEV